MGNETNRVAVTGRRGQCKLHWKHPNLTVPGLYLARVRPARGGNVHIGGMGKVNIGEGPGSFICYKCSSFVCYKCSSFIKRSWYIEYRTGDGGKVAKNRRSDPRPPALCGRPGAVESAGGTPRGGPPSLRAVGEELGRGGLSGLRGKSYGRRRKTAVVVQRAVGDRSRATPRGW